MAYNPYLSKDCYKILGVARDADREAIRKAHQNLLKTCYPDKLQKGDDESDTDFEKRKHDAGVRFSEVQGAYDVLKDDDLRARLNKNLEYSEKHGFSADSGNEYAGGMGGGWEDLFNEFFREWFNREGAEHSAEKPKSSSKKQQSSTSQERVYPDFFQKYGLSESSESEFQRYYCRQLFSLLVTNTSYDAECVAAYGRFAKPGNWFPKNEEFFIFKKIEELQASDKLLGKCFEIDDLGHLFGGISVRTGHKPDIAKRAWVGSQELMRELIRQILPKTDYDKVDSRKWDNFTLHRGHTEQIAKLRLLIDIAEDRFFGRCTAPSEEASIEMCGYEGSIKGMYFFGRGDIGDNAAQRFATFMGEPWKYEGEQYWDSISCYPFVSFPGNFASIHPEKRKLYQDSIEDAVAKAILLLRAKGFEVGDLNTTEKVTALTHEAKTSNLKGKRSRLKGPGTEPGQ